MARNCAQEILKKIPEADIADIERIVKGMDKLKKDAFLEGVSNPDSVYRQKALKYLNDYRGAVLSSKIKVLENIIKKQNIKSFAGQFPTFEEGLESRLGGSAKRIKGSRYSIDEERHGIRNILLSQFQEDLGGDKALGKIFQRGDLDKQIIIETYELSKQRHGGKANVGRSGSQEALKIAKAVDNLNQSQLKIMNNAGAMINDLEGYVVMQTHDADAITSVSFEDWKNKILPRLDYEATFNKGFEKANPDEYLKAIYDEIIERKPKILQAEDSDSLVKIIGTPGNMAKRLEQGRKLTFNSPEDFYEYNKEFGKHALWEQIVTKSDRVARNAALMQNLGTNPKATFESMIVGLDPAKRVKLQQLYSELDGSTSIPGKSPMATAGRYARLSQSWAKLGSSMLSSIPDLAFRAAQLNVAGEGLLSSQFTVLKSFFDNASSKENRALMQKLTGVGADSLIGGMFDRFSAVDSIPGKLSKSQNVLMNLSGQGWWTDNNKLAHGQILSAGLGERSHIDYSALEPVFAKNLQAFNIGPKEWALMRSVVEMHDGVKYIGYGSIDSLDNVAVKKILKMEKMTDAQAERFKLDTKIKVSTYFSDQVRTGMNEAGIKERQFLLRGTNEDMVEGQLLRFFAQFKSYPITAITKSLNQIVYQNGQSSFKDAIKNGNVVGGLASLMVASTVLGYVSGAIKDIAKGKTPKDPTLPETWGEAMVRGGGMGMYGDYILGEFDSRHGRSALSALAGPVIGQTDDLFEIWNTVKSEDEEGGKTKSEKLLSEVFRFTLNNTPGQNLFYIRGAIDHLFLYNIQETLNPGFMDRMQTRMEDKGQEFFVK